MTPHLIADLAGRGPPLREFLPGRFTGEEGGVLPVDAQDLRDKAQHCRDLLRVAVGHDVRDQLREWAEDFETDADAIERERVKAAER